MNKRNPLGTFALGLDLGPLFGAGALAPAAREAGATWARVHVGLAGFAEPDDEFVKRGLHELTALAETGLRVVAALGPDFTVAPGGLGSFADPPAGSLHDAWDMEWAANLERIAAAWGDHVEAWELLAHPDDPAAPIAPPRWALHVLAGAAAIRRGAPDAVVLPGAVIADGDHEPSHFLGTALEAAAGHAWREANLGPFTLSMQVLPKGGASEEDVIAAVRRAADAAGGLAIVSWSADACGEEEQARNLWAAFNTLSSHGHYGPVIWDGLLDTGHGRGLFRGAAVDENERRPAWAAFSDFALYAAQIAPTGAAVDWSLLDESPGEPSSGSETSLAGGTQVGGTGSGPGAAPERTGEVVRLRVPSADELLRAQGLSGRRLEAAVEVLASLHPFALQSGEYDLPLPPDLELGPAYTNQDVISAFYRVGGGTWDLLERAGIALGALTKDRDATYSGVSVEDLAALTDDERIALIGELERVKAPPAIR